MSSSVDSTVTQLLDVSTSVVSLLAVLGQNDICPIIFISRNKSMITRMTAKTFLKSTNQFISLIFLPMRHRSRLLTRNTLCGEKARAYLQVVKHINHKLEVVEYYY